MHLLLDTHTFLWWVTDAAPLSSSARAAITDADNTCLLSMASVWEMAIKRSLGKLELNGDLGHFLAEQLPANQIALLPIELHHAVRVVDLPWHHRDPFDRLLVAQALCDGLTLVSADAALAAYGAPMLW
jgi:PIN domain nuclease of toxin-antitoxin system